MKLNITDTLLPSLGRPRCLLCILEEGRDHEDVFAPHAHVDREQDRSCLLGINIVTSILGLAGMPERESIALAARIVSPCLRHVERLERLSPTIGGALEQVGTNIIELARRHVSKAMASSSHTLLHEELDELES